MQENEEDIENFPMAYSIDNAILMHRDVHFGGDFNTMLEYYKQEGKGVNKEFDITRIEELYQMEKVSERNLSLLLLSGAEAEKISLAKETYQKLRDLYEIHNPKNRYPRLIADLILAEEEESAAAIEAIVAEKGAIVPELVNLLRNEDFYDPLFPGYGQAPSLAAECLGRIGDKRAIISLFETIGSSDFFNEDNVLNALYSIGKPSKDFLLKVLHARPLTGDNEQAAIALIKFKDDLDVSSACLKMLHEIDLNKNTPLAIYLVLACEGLSSESQRKELLELAEKPTTPRMVRQDILTLSKIWGKY